MILTLKLMYGLLGHFQDQLKSRDCKWPKTVSAEKLINALQQARMEIEIILIDL